MFFSILECWTHEEGKGWRRVHVGAEHQTSTPVSATAAASGEKSDETGNPDAARLSLIDLTSEQQDEESKSGKEEKKNSSETVWILFAFAYEIQFSVANFNSF